MCYDKPRNGNAGRLAAWLARKDALNFMNENAGRIAASKAGRRFIALMNFYNAGDFKRLRQFVHSSYYDLTLMENPADRRMLDLKATRKLHGRLKVVEIEKAEDYAIGLILQGEKGASRLRLEMVVNESYPHQIIHYALRPIERG